MVGPHAFATAPETLLPIERAGILYDGTITEPRLSSPEGVAVGPDGYVWCGTDRGEIMRIAPDGSAVERVATTDGFALGLAFDGDRALFVCDLKHRAVFRLDLKTHQLTRFSSPGIRIPNFPLVDKARNRLLVSDSYSDKKPGPGIWALDLDTGEGGLWYDRPLTFANGLASRNDDDAVYVCETFARRVSRIPVAPDGSAGKRETFADNLPALPDGLAFDGQGNLIVSGYEPSRILRVTPDGARCDVLIEDPTAHIFCHPTNIAFAGDTLYAANLGRWHITRVEMDVGAPPLWEASR